MKGNKERKSNLNENRRYIIKRAKKKNLTNQIQRNNALQSKISQISWTRESIFYMQEAKSVKIKSQIKLEGNQETKEDTSITEKSPLNLSNQDKVAKLDQTGKKNCLLISDTIQQHFFMFFIQIVKYFLQLEFSENAFIISKIQVHCFQEQFFIFYNHILQPYCSLSIQARCRILTGQPIKNIFGKYWPLQHKSYLYIIQILQICIKDVKINGPRADKLPIHQQPQHIHLHSLQRWGLLAPKVPNPHYHRSRIQNLPSYRKQDLSARINFVVVFQTIQIQRLSNQIQALRIALKDQQRQNFNIKNYEVQIRQLTQKCFAYQNQRYQYREQVDKLNVICQKLYEELETMKIRFGDIDPTIKEKYRIQKEKVRGLEEENQKWRNRYNALESSKNREMEDMKLMMESQRKSTIDRQIKQLTLKFSSERQSLQKQIRKLREALQTKDIELQRVTSRISQLQIMNQQLRQYQKTIDDYQTKFAMISQQTMRLNDLLRRKQQEIQKLGTLQNNYKRKCNEFQRKIKDLEENGGEKARNLENQIRDWRSKYSRLEDESKGYQKELAQIPEFKSAIQQISKESQRLKDAVKQKMGEIDDWKSKYQRIQVQYRDKRAEQQQKIPALQQKLSQIHNQNDRLSSTLKSRTAQLQQSKQKLADIDRRIPSLQNQKRTLQQTLSTHVRNINDLQSNIKQLQSQARRIPEMQRQANRQRQQKQQCKKQINRLNGVVSGNLGKLEGLERKCQKLERDLKNFGMLEEEIRVYKQKESTLTRQLDRINGIIVQKIKQIQALKQQFQTYQTTISTSKQLQQKLSQSLTHSQKLLQDLDQSRKQNSQLQQKLFTSQSTSKKLQSDIFSLSQQQQNMTKVINTKTQQLQNVEMEMRQLQGLVSRMQGVQGKNRELEEKCRGYQGKIGESQRKWRSQLNRNKQLSQNIQSLTQQITKIKREGTLSPKFKQQYYQVVQFSQSLQKQIVSLHQRIATLQQIIRKLKEVTQKQQQISKKNGERVQAFGKQFQIAAAAFKKNLELNNQIFRLNQENMQLQSKFRISNVENETMKMSRRDAGGKSPIDMLSTKRGLDTEFNSPYYKKSSSQNTLNPTNYPSPSYQKSKQDNDYGYSYTYQQSTYSNQTPSSTSSIPSSSGASSMFPTSAYEYSSTMNSNNYGGTGGVTGGGNQGKGKSGGFDKGFGNTGGNYQYNYEYSSSTTRNPNQQPSSSSSSSSTNLQSAQSTMGSTFGRKGSYETFSNIGGAFGNTGNTGAYGNTSGGAYGNTNSGSGGGAYGSAFGNTGGGGAFRINTEESSYSSNINKNTGGGDNFINFQAFGKKNVNASNTGVKPAGLPMQFRSTKPQF